MGDGANGDGRWGDGRWAKGDGRRAWGVGRGAMGEGRWAMGDGGWSLGGGRGVIGGLCFWDSIYCTVEGVVVRHVGGGGVGEGAGAAGGGGRGRCTAGTGRRSSRGGQGIPSRRRFAAVRTAACRGTAAMRRVRPAAGSGGGPAPEGGFRQSAVGVAGAGASWDKEPQQGMLLCMPLGLMPESGGPVLTIGWQAVDSMVFPTHCCRTPSSGQVQPATLRKKPTLLQPVCWAIGMHKQRGRQQMRRRKPRPHRCGRW